MDPTHAPVEIAHDLSFLGLFLQADPIVKGVMILLVVASVACWTVMLEKVVRFAGAKRQAKAFDALVRANGALETEGRGLARSVTRAAVEAWRDQDTSETRAERRDRIERAMRAALTLDIKRLQTGLPLLATAGSTAPFIGLFGTVWGIMNSFSAIAKSQDTSLAVVAPGIAEALFATAIGLIVAIPAVMAYNKLTNDLGRIQSAFVSSIGILGNRLARDRTVQGRAAAAE
ncbi:flagellar motor protein MotA [Methylobacterium sp. Leaf399]|uniref:MotA/TolQ/ExbB proton channel family protein n=1 Tax=unclassified Methylobacterium TaxID=2615210 RepID=UPI0006FE168E|nr:MULTISPECIES: MotA/TolQ/ExbB proton channel family protein [unclassified Methylobacterium]KQP51736.1 flagellar motor protein MotA [Methylobacterium sp. Leaf108]KQT14847.1 flagellar motor protein MotA [Methylobacterium sp. Leaf399]KQT90512.1 flagellar motor protein MotA [Methylobacterium sp. Leaf466]